jgi:hypothetical protein
MSDFATVVSALELVVGNTRAVEILKAVETDNSALIADNLALTNKCTALEAALAKSQADAMNLVTAIQAVRADAADGVLDNPIPDPVVVDPVVDPTPAPAPSI